MQEDDQVGPQNAELNNSPMSPQQEDLVGAASLAAGECYWNDKKYSDGATVCDSGQRYKCWNGRWVDVGNC